MQPASPPRLSALRRLRERLPRVELDAALLPCKSFCFWISAGQACYYAFLPLVYAQLGLSPSQVGVLTGVAPLVQAAASPAWAAGADAWQAHRVILLGTLVAGAGLHCLLPLCPRRMSFLLPLVVFSEAVAAPTVPLADAAIGLTLQRAGKPFSEYGKQRLWGAVSWGFIFAPAVGALETYAPPGRFRAAAPYAGHVACYALAFAAARRLAQPDDSPLLATRACCAEDATADDTAVPSAPPAAPPADFGAVVAAVAAAVRATPGAALRLALFFILGAIMGTIGSFLFLWLAELGGTQLLDGLALTVTCLSEVAVFYYAGAIQERLGGTAGCLRLVVACYLARVLYYAALPALGGAWAVLPVQLLHGITFGLLWQVGNAYMRSLAPPGLEPSLQALFAGLLSAGSCAGNVVAGAVVQRHGYPALFLCLAALAVLAQALLSASCALERGGAKRHAPSAAGYGLLAEDEDGGADAERDVAHDAAPEGVGDATLDAVR